MEREIITVTLIVSIALSGCLGGGASDPLQTVADNSGDDYTRDEAAGGADRALEFHGIEQTEENRERLADLALEAAQEDPNQTPDNILVCMNGAPPDQSFESYTPNGWDAIDKLAEACA